MIKIKKEYIAPWEKVFDKILSPLDEFIHHQTTRGILFILCAITTLYLANSPLSIGKQAH